jgi:hypothetical protein
MFSGLVTDLKHVLRVLGSSRTFTGVAVLSLAIGIGANAAIYSVIRVLLLDPLAVRSPEELSLVYWYHPGEFTVSSMNSSGHRDPATGLQLRSNYSYPIYREMRTAAPPGIGMFGFNFLRDVAVQYADQPALSAGGLIADGAYFPILGPGMALGRPFGEADDVDGGPVVAVLSHGFWMRAFGGDPAIIGKTVRVNGVPTHNVVVRSSVPIETLEPALRHAVTKVNRDLTVPSIKSQVAQMRETTIRERVFAQLLTAFGAFALLLACIGLYGVTSYSVARRTNEIGVRMALGAQRSQVLWLVQREVGVLALIGLVIGVPVAVALAPLFGSLLFGVAPTDRGVLAISAIVMLAVAFGAGLLPARRAATMDPLAALRAE